MRLLVHLSSSSIEGGEDVSLHGSMEDLLARIPAAHIDARALIAISGGTDVSWVVPIAGGVARHTALWREVPVSVWDLWSAEWIEGS